MRLENEKKPNTTKYDYLCKENKIGILEPYNYGDSND